MAHIRKELQRLDGIAQRAEEVIEKLREYRQALITAAVTGKLDVTSPAPLRRATPRHPAKAARP